MKTVTLAEKLGSTPHVSALLQKAAQLGLDSPERLESLGVVRGCWHYRHPEIAPVPTVAEGDFSNEELAVALLSPSLPYSPHTIRVGAAMLGATNNRVETLLELTTREQSTAIVRYIAQAARRFEPDNLFWSQLLERLPEMQTIKDGVMPHPTRFVSMTGMTRAGMGPLTIWIRPRADLALANG